VEDSIRESKLNYNNRYYTELFTVNNKTIKNGIVKFEMEWIKLH
jgi:hypothetical protein